MNRKVSRYMYFTMWLCIAVTINVNFPVLDMGNFREMVDITRDHLEEWKFIGIGLGFKIYELDNIESSYRHSFDCLIALLEHWLKCNDPTPTRGAMTAALQSHLVTNLDEGMCMRLSLSIACV